MTDWNNLWSRFASKDRLALARLLTLASRGEGLSEIRSHVAQVGTRSASKGTRVFAFTGAGGVGKSTLVGKMMESFRGAGLSVAVLACDPQSPLTGGALLGDRLRMPNRADDAGVFVRSLATPGGHEAVAEHLDLMIDLLEAFGFDVILLETVGAGQGDTAVRFLADALVVLVQPEAGDDIQWEKAGLLEVADVVVVHKADLPGADRTEAQVKSLLNLPGCRDVPIHRVSSAKNQGLEALRDRLLTLPRRRGTEAKTLGQLNRLLLEELEERQRTHASEWHGLLADWQAGRRTANETVDAALALLRS